MGTATAAGTKLGRYQVVKHLASGGMAEVLLARATGIEGFTRHVVIKRIRPSQAKDATFVQMFLNEARLAAQLHHHNIVQVHDIGQEGNEYFFAMEYVHGEDLRRLLTHVARHKQKVPLEHVVAIVTAAATALHYAHEQLGPDRKPLGLVHRDVTPANILVGYDGHVKVVDFGIAKAAARTHEATQAGTLKGKASYMSPEQCTGKSPVDRRSDVFALGIVLYELATARRLFKAENDFLTMSAIVAGKITPPHTYRSDLPPELAAIIMKALALAPEDRYQTADEMREALEQFAAKAGLRMSTSALAAYMKLQFGERLEPWLVDDDDVDIVLTVDFDGSASGMAAPPPEALEQSAIPESVEAMKSSPIMKARTRAITGAPPLPLPPGSSKPITRQIPVITVPIASEKSRSFRVPTPPPAAPTPRRKPLTVQIPVVSQAAGAPPKPAEPDGGSLPGVAPDDDLQATVVTGAPLDLDESWEAPAAPTATPPAGTSTAPAAPRAGTSSAGIPRTATPSAGTAVPAATRTATPPAGSPARSATPPAGSPARSATPPSGTSASSPRLSPTAFGKPGGEAAGKSSAIPRMATPDPSGASGSSSIASAPTAPTSTSPTSSAAERSGAGDVARSRTRTPTKLPPPHRGRGDHSSPTTAADSSGVRGIASASSATDTSAASATSSTSTATDSSGARYVTPTAPGGATDSSGARAIAAVGSAADTSGPSDTSNTSSTSTTSATGGDGASGATDDAGVPDSRDGDARELPRAAASATSGEARSDASAGGALAAAHGDADAATFDAPPTFDAPARAASPVPDEWATGSSPTRAPSPLAALLSSPKRIAIAAGSVVALVIVLAIALGGGDEPRTAADASQPPAQPAADDSSAHEARPAAPTAAADDEATASANAPEDTAADSQALPANDGSDAPAADVIAEPSGEPADPSENANAADTVADDSATDSAVSAKPATKKPAAKVTRKRATPTKRKVKKPAEKKPAWDPDALFPKKKK